MCVGGSPHASGLLLGQFLRSGRGCVRPTLAQHGLRDVGGGNRCGDSLRHWSCAFQRCHLWHAQGECSSATYNTCLHAVYIYLKVYLQDQTHFVCTTGEITVRNGCIQHTVYIRRRDIVFCGSARHWGGASGGCEWQAQGRGVRQSDGRLGGERRAGSTVALFPFLRHTGL